MTTADDDLRMLKAELWLIGKLGTPALFVGVTDDATKRERVRSVIVSRKLADVVVGRKDGEAETFRQVFERLYNTPLTTGDS